MNFKDFLFLFINEPSQLGELVRAIFYSQSRNIKEQFQQDLINIISKEEKEDLEVSNELITYFDDANNNIKIDEYMLNNKQELLKMLLSCYDAYRTLNKYNQVGSNNDVFGTQYTSKDIPITETDKTRTKIIGLETEHKCLICQSNIYTKIFKQILSIDFLNDTIKSSSYFQCQKCNNITIDL